MVNILQINFFTSFKLVNKIIFVELVVVVVKVYKSKVMEILNCNILKNSENFQIKNSLFNLFIRLNPKVNFLILYK